MADKIIKALLTKLQMLLDETESRERSFLSFYIPGLPISSKDLDFSSTKNNSELTPQERLKASSNFANLVNQIPKASSRWSSDQSLLWNQYKSILTQSVVALDEPSDAEKQQLQEARNFLYQREKITDLLGTRTVIVESQNLADYRKYQQLYLQALSEYNSHRLDAKFSDNPRVQQEWQIQEKEYKSKVENAKNDWINIGKRWEVEAKFNIVDQITGRNPQIIWAQWKDDFEQFRLTNLDNQDFYETHFHPENFYKPNAENQWTQFTLNTSEIKQLESEEANFSERIPSGLPNLELAVSSLSVELIRVPIIRPWLNVGLFNSRAWRFPDNRKPLSDGNKTPQGSLVAYTNSIIFIRNLQIKLDSEATDNSSVLKDIESGKLTSLGIFSLDKPMVASDSQSIKSEGMQIIAFACQKLPKSPNPDPSLDWLDDPDALRWIGKTEQQLSNKLGTEDGTSIFIKIENYTNFDLQKTYEDKKYGIYKDAPLTEVPAKSSQGFTTSQELLSGPEGWLVYSFNEQYNVMLYWQNFWSAKNKGCMSFIPTNIRLERNNVEKYTKEENIIRIQDNFICDATIGSGFQRARFTYTIKPK